MINSTQATGPVRIDSGPQILDAEIDERVNAIMEEIWSINDPIHDVAMERPVVHKSCGQLFEYSSIREWITSRSPTCPQCRENSSLDDFPLVRSIQDLPQEISDAVRGEVEQHIRTRQVLRETGQALRKTIDEKNAVTQLLNSATFEISEIGKSQEHKMCKAWIEAIRGASDALQQILMSPNSIAEQNWIDRTFTKNQERIDCLKSTLNRLILSSRNIQNTLSDSHAKPTSERVLGSRYLVEYKYKRFREECIENGIIEDAPYIYGLSYSKAFFDSIEENFNPEVAGLVADLTKATILFTLAADTSSEKPADILRKDVKPLTWKLEKEPFLKDAAFFVLGSLFYDSRHIPDDFADFKDYLIKVTEENPNLFSAARSLIDQC